MQANGTLQVQGSVETVMRGAVWIGQPSVRVEESGCRNECQAYGPEGSKQNCGQLPLPPTV